MNHLRGDKQFVAIAIVMVLISYDLSTAQNIDVVQPESKVRLLMTGHQETAPPVFPPGEVWFAIHRESAQWSLRAVRPSAVAETPRMGLEATHISAEAIADGTFLIGGVPHLREGPVKASIDAHEVIYLGQSVSILHGYSLQAEGTAVGAEYGGMWFLDYAFWLTGRNSRELLVMRPRMSTDNPPSVKWAGDLDRDGVPDLVLNVPLGDVGTHFILFLSSMAPDGQMVLPVATWSIPGC